MNQDDIATMFRANELQNRAERRKGLQASIENELRLSKEYLSDYDKLRHAAALKRLREQDLAYIRESKYCYWKKLWLALWGEL